MMKTALAWAKKVAIVSAITATTLFVTPHLTMNTQAEAPTTSTTNTEVWCC